MRKFLKRLLKWFVGFITIFIVLMVGVFLVVDPNKFKGPVERAFLSQYGQVLSINGPLNWTWSPLLSLELHDIVLENPQPFKDKMLSAKSLRTELGVASLFTGKWFINIHLSGVKLSLERNSKGVENWDTLVQRLSNKKTSGNSENHTPSDAASNNSISNDSTPNNSISSEGTSTIANSSSDSTSSKILFSGIKIEDAEIRFDDHQKNKHYILDHLNVSAENITKAFVGHSTPVSINFHLGNANKQAVGRFSLKCAWAYMPLKDEATFRNISLKFEFPAGKITNINGEALVTNVSDRPQVQGKIESSNIDIKPWLDELGIKYDSSLPTAGAFSTTFKYNAPTLSLNNVTLQLVNNGSLIGNLKADLTHVSTNDLRMEGDFLAKQLQVGKLKLDEVKGLLLAKEGIIKLAPMTLQMAQSTQLCSLQIDLRGQTPRYTFTQQGKGFNIKNLLLMMGVKDKLEGNTSLKINLTTMGRSLEELKSNLSGQTEIEMVDGKFYGINLIALLKNAQTGVHSLVSGLKNKKGFNLDSGLNSVQALWKEKTPNPTSFTPFNAFKATTVINQGVVKNSDLSITHPEYVVNGTGNINLINDTIQYQTAVLYKGNAYPKEDAFGKYLENMALPVRVEGTLGNPMIRPDLKTYTNNALAYAQKNIVEEAIQKNVEKNVEKVVGNALNQLLNKGKDN